PLTLPFVSHDYPPHRALHSFPTRRSSDLSATRSRPQRELFTHDSTKGSIFGRFGVTHTANRSMKCAPLPTARSCTPISFRDLRTDRKSTRLNSSHLGISYAVFCLKKKTKK